MTDKNTRGRASKVDLLPPNIKTQLAMMLRDKHLSQAQILEEINDLIRDCGLDDSYQLSRTGLNRYASRMEQMASKIRNAREVAEIWTKQFGEAPQSDIGKLLMEIVKNLAFETSIGMSENGQAEPKDLALLSSAARLIVSWRIACSRLKLKLSACSKRAAEAVEEVGKEQGVSLEDVQKMVKAVYGIE